MNANVTPIERVGPLTPDQFQTRYSSRDRPVVIEGGARHFPAIGRWSPEYLKRTLGGLAIRFKQSASHRHPDFSADSLDVAFRLGNTTFGEFLDEVTQGPEEQRAHKLFTGDEQFLLRKRDGSITVNPDLELLYRDVELPLLFPEESLYTIWAWFSGPGVRTWLHYDNNGCHNLNAQITGHKRCWLFSPEEMSRLHLFPIDGQNPAYNCSEIDVESPDRTRFSDFLQAPRSEAELFPGDLLFIPAWWLHSFFHLGELNSNVNFWWKPARPRENPVARRQAVIDARASA